MKRRWLRILIALAALAVIREGITFLMAWRRPVSSSTSLKDVAAEVNRLLPAMIGTEIQLVHTMAAEGRLSMTCGSSTIRGRLKLTRPRCPEFDERCSRRPVKTPRQRTSCWGAGSRCDTTWRPATDTDWRHSRFVRPSVGFDPVAAAVRMGAGQSQLAADDARCDQEAPRPKRRSLAGQAISRRILTWERG